MQIYKNCLKTVWFTLLREKSDLSNRQQKANTKTITVIENGFRREHTMNPHRHTLQLSKDKSVQND